MMQITSSLHSTNSTNNMTNRCRSRPSINNEATLSFYLTRSRDGDWGHQYSDTMCLSIIHYVVKPFSVKQTLSGFFSPNSPSCFQSVSYVFPCVWSCLSFVGFSDRCVFPHCWLSMCLVVSFPLFGRVCLSSVFLIAVFPHCWLHLQVVHLPGR